ncbi:MAG TPA: metal ABC transporter substrate-binding protein, partial [Abditibacteriaceae bacterium]|nr:metal ABC transporter substrate-binding protein [Abditibacteriaceae bacterium]
ATSVVTSIPELAEIAAQVGGNKVTVYSLARPNRDYHAIEPRPSDVQRIARASLVVRSGLSLDLWMDALMRAAGNSALNVGGSRYVDASASIPRIEVPTAQITGASGDVHPGGNPHYYYDPIYAKFAARNILRGLIRVDGANANTYRANYKRFNAEIDRRMVGWQKELAPYRGKPVVAYHRSYSYFIRRFGLRHFGTIEPKPGIPPSARHVNVLTQRMKSGAVKAVIIESIYPTRYADLLTRQTGAKYAVAPYSVGSLGTSTYFNMIEKLVDSFKQALSR